jgi:uncharacterized Zn-binding protein involved in type VI secretion
MKTQQPSRHFLISTLGIGVLGVALVGCSSTTTNPQTVGEKTEVQGKQIADAGDLLQKGEKMLVDGKAKVAEGETLTNQGKIDEGKKAADAGHQLVADGEALIKQAQDIKNRALVMPITTAPTTMPALP